MPTDGTGKARIDRRLAAVVAADVVAYSHHMHLDEEGTHARFKAHRGEVIDPCIAMHKGRIVKSTGDGFLAEFPSAVAAARCMIEVQTALAARNLDLPPEHRIQFRIGINLGDIIIEQEDIFGDGVNIAARLEAIAEPGGICISGKVYDEISEKLDLACADMGLQRLKNIARPVRVYRVDLGNLRSASALVTMPSLALPDKPSIAVLPFTNMSVDPDQEYFADGMVEDITVALSRIRWLFVVARNSSFTYKGKSVDVKQVGRELEVRYVLEGSVRKATSRVRINAELIDTSTGAHLWGDRFDSELVDLFDLQDQLTLSVLGAIAPRLERAEFERAKRKPIGSLDAYDYYWRGWSSADQVTREATADALQLLCKAIELDPNLALAHGRAALCYSWRAYNGWATDQAQESAEAIRLARRAAELDQDEALALSWAGITLSHLLPDSEEGAALLERALALNTNLMQAWFGTGWVRLRTGQLEAAIEAFGRAMRLSPLDPFTFAMQQGIALAHFLAGRYDQASLWAEKTLRAHQSDPGALRVAAASNALAGRPEEARRAMGHLRQREPALRVSNLRSPSLRPEDLAKLAGALRIAGLPE